MPLPDPTADIGIKRRTFLRSLLLVIAGSSLPPVQHLFAAPGQAIYPQTASILQLARTQELTAHNHYRAYIRQALQDDFPNIAYLFEAFATSEQIHAVNFSRLLTDLNQPVEEPSITIEVGSTRDNLRKAAGKEMTKITRFYPNILDELKEESFTPAIDACHYAWQSHRQHEKEIRRIKKYSGWFFGQVADRIEGQPFDFHVCDACGSTVASKPKDPCDICTLSADHYRPIARPRS